MKVSAIHEEVLDNGIQVVHAGTRASPAILALVRAGGYYETEKNSGISHVAEHLLFSGTNQEGIYTEDEIYYRISELTGEMDNGNDWSCYTTFDHVTLGLRTLPTEFESAAHLISAAFSDSRITPLAVEREKLMVIDEMSGYAGAYSLWMMPMFLSAIFKKHPLRRYPGGTEKSVAELSYDEVYSFYQKMFIPELIIVVGDITFKDAMRIVDTHFASFSQRKLDFPNIEEEPENYGEQSTSHIPNSNRAHLKMGIKIFNPAQEEIDLLNIAGAYFGRSFHEKIYTKEAISYNRWGAYVDILLESAPKYGFLIASAGFDAKYFARAEEIMRELFDELAEGGLLEGIITQLAQSYAKSYMFIRENSLALARSFLHDHLRGRIRHPDEYVASFSAANSKKVERVTEKYIAPLVRANLLTKVALIPKNSNASK